MRLVFFFVIAATFSARAYAGQLVGPGRFCGYSPIIDLLAGERVTTLEGGIHAGSFRWEGKFGSLEVAGFGWGARPSGPVAKEGSGTKPIRFAQRRIDGRYQISIWNGTHGVAHFRSDRPFTSRQIAAIDRVELFEEGQEPRGCKLRTLFSWE